MAALTYTRYSARFNWQSGNFGREVRLAPRQTERVGSWTESYEHTGPFTPQDLTNFHAVMQKRAQLLPRGASIIDTRYQTFLIPDGQIRPRPQASRLVGFERGPISGNTDYSANHPNDCLKVPVRADGNPNKSWFYFHCIPDEIVQGGELIAGDPFNRWRDLWNEWKGEMTARNFGWVGVNTGADSGVCNKIAGNSVTIGGIPGSFVAGAYVAPYRVRLDDGASMRGTYQIAAAPVAGVITLSPAVDLVLTKPSGLFRLVTKSFMTYLLDADFVVNTGKVITKKIGSSLKNYVGRRSRRR